MSDDSVDPMMLQIEKDQVKNVKFNKMESIIPASEIDDDEQEGEDIDGQEGKNDGVDDNIIICEGGESGEGSQGDDSGDCGDVEKDGRSGNDSGAREGNGEINAPFGSVVAGSREGIRRSNNQKTANYINSLSLADKHDPPHSPDTRRKLSHSHPRSNSSPSLPTSASPSMTKLKRPHSQSQLPTVSQNTSYMSTGKGDEGRRATAGPTRVCHSPKTADSGYGHSKRNRTNMASYADTENTDDRLHRLVTEAFDSSTSDSEEEQNSGHSRAKTNSSSSSSSGHVHLSTKHSLSTSGRRSPRPQSLSPNQGQLAQDKQQPASQQQQPQQQPQQQQNQQEPEFTKPETNSSSIFFSRSQRELSRLLVEKMPLEILKRMVIRWPVGNEVFRDHSALAESRLMLTIWDAAGDPLQQNFIPFFFTDRCFFIATYNLLKDLDQPCVSYKNKDLTNVDGSFPTNAEVLESWIGNATAFQKPTPSIPFHCNKQTPLLPPLVLTCTNIDQPTVSKSPIQFHNFFDRDSFQSYKKHLVESNSPSALCLSNHYETLVNKSEEEVPEIPYGGHHLLRREIDYLARLMPYKHDRVPVQWVKFEQLIYGLQQQKKVILLYNDLARYIQEHCKLSGPLQLQPVLSHFHDVGVIAYFYRHPELSNLVITNPQWLASALSSLITSNPGKWITPEVKNAFAKLGREGVIEKEMLQLAYRCAHMRQRYWNEMLFILNCMDLVCCHPSLHSSNSLYVPAMVLQVAPDPYVIPNDNDPCQLYFSTCTAAVPLAIFNQLVVRCIRSCRYAPKIYFQWAHIQLNSSHHLLLWKEHTAIVCLVQSNVSDFCRMCSKESNDDTADFSPQCSTIAHLVGEQSELMPTDNISQLIRNSTNSGVNIKLHLAFSDEEDSCKKLCSRVRCFLEKNLQFLCNCWYPGLEVELQCQLDEERVTLNQYWKHTTLKTGKAPQCVSVWFR